MARLAANKSTLKDQRDKLKLYGKFLPSLESKKQQLLTEFQKARAELKEAEQETEQLTAPLGELMKPLGASQMDLKGLVTIDSVVVVEENMVGARLPVAREVKFRTAEYSTLAKPFWVDFLVESLQRMCTTRVHLLVRRERVRRLNLQVRRITQRVNLFAKVLIPKAKENVKRIRIGLAEDERSAVVRSKIAKRKNK